MSLFHKGHYNKIAAVLGRRIAIEQMEYGANGEFGPEDGVIRSVGGFAVMFGDDNSRFDKDKFAKAVYDHARRFRESLSSSS